MQKRDVIILGNGLIAKTLSLGLMRIGIKSKRISAAFPSYKNDPRSYAMAPSSLRMLNALGLIFSEDELTHVRSVELGFGDVLRDPVTSVSNGGDMFVMINHHILDRKLQAALKDEALEGAPSEFAFTPYSMQLPEFLFETQLIVIAEGKQSDSIAKLGFALERHDYHQIAITAKFETQIPHGGKARQLFESTGPLGLLPFGQNGLSIVWSQWEEHAKTLIGLDDLAFCTMLEAKIGKFYGDLKLVGDRSAFPLSSTNANRLVSDRIALIGDSAHVVHPIAGQGLNLGLRDVACLVESIRQAKIIGMDIGSDIVLGQYKNWRTSDISRIAVLTRGVNEMTQSQAPLMRAANLFTQAALKYEPLRKQLAKMSDSNLEPQPPLLKGMLY